MSIHKNKLQDTYESLEWKNWKQLKFEDFKALAFANIKQDKLDARDMKCVFIGYCGGVKGYKRWKMYHEG